mgnify:CR=1 FL=1
MGIFSWIRDKYRENRFYNSLEKAVRSNLLLYQLRDHANNQSYDKTDPIMNHNSYSIARNPVNKRYREPKKAAADLLRRRIQNRERGNEIIREMEKSIREKNKYPLKRLTDYIEQLAESNKAELFEQYVQNPVNFKKAAKAFVENVESKLRGSYVQTLEYRVQQLEKKLERYEKAHNANQHLDFYIPKYNANLATNAMKKEIVQSYCTDYRRSLKAIAKDLSEKYGMNVSESTMRRIARKELGNVSRRDRSAEKAYLRKIGKKPLYAERSATRHYRK